MISSSVGPTASNKSKIEPYVDVPYSSGLRRPTRLVASRSHVDGIDIQLDYTAARFLQDG